MTTAGPFTLLLEQWPEAGALDPNITVLAPDIPNLTYNLNGLELVLDRGLSDRRVYPAIDINRSGTRREDKLLSRKDLSRIWILRRLLNDMNPSESINFLLDRLQRTKNNREFLDSMST